MSQRCDRTSRGWSTTAVALDGNELWQIEAQMDPSNFAVFLVADDAVFIPGMGVYGPA